MLTVWGPLYNKLRSAIWNDIFMAYKESCPDSERTLPQVKKRQQNLEYEYKLLKQRSQSTGEAGFKKIKEGFPYFNFFDDVMGHRDSVDPSKMALEGSSTFAFEESSSTSLSPQGSVADGGIHEQEAEILTEILLGEKENRTLKKKPRGKAKTNLYVFLVKVIFHSFVHLGKF